MPNAVFGPDAYLEVRPNVFAVALLEMDGPHISQELFFRKQEVLSYAYETGTPVQILGSWSGGSSCSYSAATMSIKLCKTVADCCSGYAECGKEISRRFPEQRPGVVIVSEDAYE